MNFSTVDIYFDKLNFVIRDRLDPILLFILACLGQANNQSWYVASQLATLFLGTAGLFWHLTRKRLVAFMGAVSFTFASVLLLGLEPVYLKFHWFPFLVLTFVCLRGVLSMPVAVLALITIVEWGLTSGPLGVFGVLVAQTASKLPAFTPLGRDENPTCLTQASLYWMMATALCYIAIPLYPMPAYPATARPAPVSPYSFLFQPLIGPMLEPNPLLYGQVMKEIGIQLERLLIIFLVLVFLSCLSAWGRTSAFWSLPNRDTQSHLSGYWGIWLCLRLFPLCELFGSFTFLAYTPFQSLVRIIPGLALQPLVWCIVPFGLLLVFVYWSRGTGGRSPGICAHLALLGSITAVLSLDFQIFSGFLWSARSPEGDHFAAVSNSKDDWIAHLRRSPSAYIVKSHGDWVGQPGKYSERNIANLERISLQGVVARASVLEEEAALALDNRLETRWRTGRPQKAGDYFLLEFPEPTEVIKVALMIPNELTDFPRGLAVQGSLGGKEFATIFQEPIWSGPLRWTESGYPYYGYQPHIVLELPEQHKVKFLKFVQLGDEKFFDWSIDEIMVFRKPR